MIWKSLKEEWPYTNDEIWLKWTTDGINYFEEIVHESRIDQIDSLGVPEWRNLDPPEWMGTADKERFSQMHGSWISKIEAIGGLQDKV